jgi:phosphoglycolate phosphatase
MARTAICFDLDGTLLDTLDDLADSMNAVLAALGCPAHPLDAYRYFVGDGVENLVRRALPEAARGNEALVREAVPLMRGEYGKRWKAKTRLYDGIPELLDALVAGGVRMAILSNKPHPAVLDVAGHFLQRWRFDAVLGARLETPIKPDPGAALEVARQLGVAPSGFLYIGDTDTDMVTALRAGMYAVGALWGFRTEAELRASGAMALASHPREVMELL